MGPLASRRLFLGIVIIFASLLTTARVVHAGTIIDLGAAGCGGSVCGVAYTDGFLTLQADGGTFTTKTRFGATGLGVSGGTQGEIDVSEFVRGTFAAPVYIDAVTILFLYNGGEFQDPMEIAEISINGGSIAGSLMSTSTDNIALWSIGDAWITNCGDTTIDGTGCFRLANPFPGTPITNIAFTALSAGVQLPNNSDFSLGSIEVTPYAPAPVAAPAAFAEPLVVVPTAPEPGVLFLLAAGSVGLVARRRYTTS